MALIFQIWIESDSNSEEIRAYFLSQQVIEVNGKQYKIAASSFHQTGSMITVDGISRIGIQSEEEAVEMTAIGCEFYRLLRGAPDFRYALVGVEVDEWRHMDELIESPNDIALMKGFVINKAVYESINCTIGMQEFSSEYLWLPYEGEKYTQENNA